MSSEAKLSHHPSLTNLSLRIHRFTRIRPFTRRCWHVCAPPMWAPKPSSPTSWMPSRSLRGSGTGVLPGVFSLKCLKKDELPNLDIHLGRRFWFCFTYSFFLVLFFRTSNSLHLQEIWIFFSGQLVTEATWKQHFSRTVFAEENQQRTVPIWPWMELQSKYLFFVYIYTANHSTHVCVCVSASIPEWHTYQHTLTQTHRQVYF